MLNYVRDAHDEALEMAHGLTDGVGLVGYGIAELYDRAGNLKSIAPFANLVTDAGDLYYAQKLIAGIAPVSPGAPTAMNGMKLGTGATTVSKLGAGAILSAYLSASNVAFDTSYPQTSNLGTTLGVLAVYKTTWPGTGLAGSITEAALVSDQATNANADASHTYCRSTFAVQTKGGTDTFAITWNHKMLGA